MSTKRPNFLIIVADDLGYSDVGCYGGEIRTPNIDRIAREGVQFTDFHSASMCSPTRSMLLSGTDNHIAGVGKMSESVRGEYPRWNVRGHEGFLNFEVAALPELMQDAGYLTLMSGKWHLGASPPTNPKARGFDRSFTLLSGCSNHYGYEPQYSDPRSFNGKIPVMYSQDGQWCEIPANTSNEIDEGFYSTQSFTSNLLKYLKDRQADPSSKEKPFFAYLPFTAPHWPLQSPPSSRDRYKGVYSKGYDELRLSRLQGLKDLGIVPDDVLAHEVLTWGTKDWEDLTSVQQTEEARVMEVYAGMVDSIDENIGRVTKYLEETGELDNTFILFMSDNGAAGAMIESRHLLGASRLDEIIERHYDNSVDNIGNHNSFVMYGPRWAQAATAPSRLCKKYTTEGGILVPCVARFPGLWSGNSAGLSQATNPKTSKSLCRSFVTVMDIMPTILELANIKHPAAGCTGRQKVPYRDTEVLGMTGRSWVPYFIRKDSSKLKADEEEVAVHDPGSWQGWELNQCGALRRDQWKVVWLPNDSDIGGKGTWELFNLDDDPGETKDLAEKETAILEEMKQLFEQYVEETGVLWGKPVANPNEPPRNDARRYDGDTWPDRPIPAVLVQ